jgi:hypothetical protein
MEIDIYRLEDLFGKRYGELCSGEEFRANKDFFIDWCDRHKIVMLHADWLPETLNDDGMRGMVCIMSPEANEVKDAPPWLLVPREFAERTLILGHLP